MLFLNIVVKYYTVIKHRHDYEECTLITCSLLFVNAFGAIVRKQKS